MAVRRIRDTDGETHDFFFCIPHDEELLETLGKDTELALLGALNDLFQCRMLLEETVDVSKVQPAGLVGHDPLVRGARGALLLVADDLR